MAVLAPTTYRPRPRVVVINKLETAVARLLPRPAMLRSVSLILLGLALPFLSVAGLLPFTLGFFFLCMALIGVGSVAALITSGEI